MVAPPVPWSLVCVSVLLSFHGFRLLKTGEPASLQATHPPLPIVSPEPVAERPRESPARPRRRRTLVRRGRKGKRPAKASRSEVSASDAPGSSALPWAFGILGWLVAFALGLILRHRQVRASGRDPPSSPLQDRAERLALDGPSFESPDSYQGGKRPDLMARARRVAQDRRERVLTSDSRR